MITCDLCGATTDTLIPAKFSPRDPHAFWICEETCAVRFRCLTLTPEKEARLRAVTPITC